MAASPEERAELLTGRVADYLARVLGTSVKAMDLERPLSDSGLDSLMAMEVRTRIQNDLGVRVSETQLIGTQTVAGLVGHLLQQLNGEEPAGTADGVDQLPEQVDAAGETSSAGQLLEKIDELGDAEVDALLEELLAESDLQPSDERQHAEEQR